MNPPGSTYSSLIGFVFESTGVGINKLYDMVNAVNSCDKQEGYKYIDDKFKKAKVRETYIL